MIIPLNEDLRIHGTPTCYQLERRQIRKGIEDWKAFKYYTKFADAVVAAAEREIRTSSSVGLTEAFEVAHDVAAKYGALLDSALEEIGKRAAA